MNDKKSIASSKSVAVKSAEKPTKKMAKVVSLINMKGGVGKTTLAVNLAWALAENARVLLVDLDPQFNATQWLMRSKDYVKWTQSDRNHTVYDILAPVAQKASLSKPSKTGENSLNVVVKVKHGATSLDLVPSSLDLIRLDTAARGTENKLNQYISRHLAQRYDYILIDCPPTASIFTQAAFIASQYYLVPIRPDPLSILGLPLLEETLAEFSENTGKQLKRIGLVLSMVRGTEAMTHASAELRARYDDVFDAQIHQRTAISEAVEVNLPIVLLDKTKQDEKQAIADLRDEFISRIEEQEAQDV